MFQWLDYQVQSWDKSRRVILKAEHGPKGSNPRYVVTNLAGEAQELYDQVYCARGEMENRIKEQQLGLFADRTSCHAWWSNQLRLLFSSAAYILMEAIRLSISRVLGFWTSDSLRARMVVWTWKFLPRASLPGAIASPYFSLRIASKRENGPF